ncbi:hypothetical protein FE810_06560 [Thalassotalea litorea]|uniref:DUF975 family protein n=1 Tax=Thalassotalea litorea TaxID=2020715 RepID=A0A5R9IQM4_9GAMM|nr:hypothetical protein [Thalassotalea litorea]TLU66347.1 hypothetical protein FE810_06560 [Thalassotalea litorea]
MNEKRYIQIGGTPEKAVSGDYKIDVAGIIKEAWKLTQANRQAIMLAVMIIMAATMVLMMAFAETMGGIDAVMADQKIFSGLNMIVTTLLSPLIVGLEMMGISFAIGMQAKPAMIFSFLRKSAFIALASLIVMCLTNLGLMLLLVPGIYLAVALSFTGPLVAEKNLSPNQAIILSLKATRFQWLKIFQVYLFVMAIFLPLAFIVVIAAQNFGVIPAAVIAVLGLSWIAPFFYYVKGILYRQIFGVRMQVLDDNAEGTGESFFSA